ELESDLVLLQIMPFQLSMDIHLDILRIVSYSAFRLFLFFLNSSDPEKGNLV
ncbi:hypothetical protein KQX54_003546, partial [Cotesia glomerata]